MSKLHVSQIAGYLEKNLEGQIDMTDYDHHKDAAERKKAFLTRALATLAASQLMDRPLTDFIESITDGPSDGGIDLVHFNEKDKTLYLVQTKWHDNGNGSITQGEMLKFISGVGKVIELSLDGFNERIKSRTADIKSAVYDATAKIVLVIAHTGSDNLSEPVRAVIENYIDKQNDTSEIMSLEVMNQSALHKAVSAGLAGNPISVDIQLLNWGQLREPHKAVYGRVFASDVASWYQNNGAKLFERNLRQFLPASTVNHDLVQTLKEKPGEFWYFNNGITAIARSLDKKPLGGNQTETGTWECKGFSVVNGAQTVGSIHAAHTLFPDIMENATVSIRIIEISEDEDAFGLAITRNTNTQNSVEKRDFVALDPEQERIRQELRFDGVDYAYKSGATKGDPEKYFDLTEATIALACSNTDVALPVQAKREISRLWDDIQKAPYKSLFNSAISGPQIWQLVQILRHVERELTRNVDKLEGREALIGVHGNRFIQWVVFKKLNITKHVRYADVSARVPQAVNEAVRDVIAEVQSSYAESYPASLFKNQTKCKAISALIL